ncbi:hypothetical protein LINPERPRIM_LOCUS7139 [Linum perenne]
MKFIFWIASIFPASIVRNKSHLFSPSTWSMLCKSNNSFMKRYLQMTQLNSLMKKEHMFLQVHPAKLLLFN